MHDILDKIENEYHNHPSEILSNVRGQILNHYDKTMQQVTGKFLHEGFSDAEKQQSLKNFYNNSPLQVKDQSGKSFDLTDYSKNESANLSPEESAIKSANVLNPEINRTVVPPEVFQAKLNALRKLQRPKVTTGEDWFKK
jgi:monomeric isocitrate dehydrogenase